MCRYIIILFLGLFFCSFAQESFPSKGLTQNDHNKIAIVNANIWIDAKTSISNAKLLIIKNKITAVGEDLTIPKGFKVVDMKNKYLYPSFIDLYSDYGMDTLKTYKALKPGIRYWNRAIHPEYNACENLNIDFKKNKTLRSMGFGAVLSHKTDGIARGTASFVSLGDHRPHVEILTEKSALCFSLKKGHSGVHYPGSYMGTIALLRQSLYDADWYKRNKDKGIEKNQSLDAYNESLGLNLLIETRSRLDINNLYNISNEFKLSFIIKGTGHEYRILDDIKRANSKLVVPINFPKAPKIYASYDFYSTNLETLKHWENAQNNLLALKKENIDFSITSNGNKAAKDFWSNLRLVYKSGLSEGEILEALTTTPARYIGENKNIGSIEKGMYANFIVFDKPLFAKNSRLIENWVQGIKYTVNKEKPHIEGVYELDLGLKTFTLSIRDTLGKIKASLLINGKKKAASLFYDQGMINLTFKADSFNFLLSGQIKGDNLEGQWADKDGNWLNWSAKKTKGIVSKPRFHKIKKDHSEYYIPAYSWKNKSQNDTIVIRNATVWTSDNNGVLKDYSVAIYKGKIVKIAKYIGVKKGVLIDGTGKHLTAGIVDEHSHIAIYGGVNESGQSVSSQVRVSDAVSPYDINIYRQLAGGVTSAQLLHGSANPIGGQSAIIKLKWEKSVPEMLFDPQPKFIKFALGENVKQANHYRRSKRYPQTRMGVEQLMLDKFSQAKKYASAKKDKTYRKDLSLDALVEILEGKRHITCHSYIQSEINMLLKLADSMGFKINTFTHILEGYKVADKLAAHGAGASTFSDWWAYKYEVKEAIPYNASIMQQAGVLTAINSDDGEMGRRLNHEAAKAIKYGNISELEAWNMITINPAKLLHIDDRVGSISVGKDADLVLWSGHPLSVYSKVEKTYIEGVCYFDIDEDEYLQEYIKSEKSRIIQKVLAKKKK